MTWATKRQNIFIDPRATLLPGVWSQGGFHTLSAITDPDGTRWVRSTRHTAGVQRIIEMKAGRISPNVQVRLRVLMRVSHATSGTVQLRGKVTDSSTGVVLAELQFPAGINTIDVQGAHSDGNEDPAFTILTSTDPVGSTMDFRAVLIENNPVPGGEYFDGGTTSPDPETKRFVWEDRPDRSVSLEQDYTAVIPGDPKYAPTIYVLGTAIPCDFEPDGQNPVVMDGITIEWGRDALYDPTNPAELRFDMIDPTGELASNPALFGAEITVETALGMLYRGRVDGISITPTTIADANTNVPNEVWAVQVSATDVIASLAKLVLPGYESGDPNSAWQQRAVKDYGPGYWAGFDTEYRRRQIQTAWNENGIPTLLRTKDFATMVPPGGAGWQEYFRESITPSGPDMYTLAQSVIHRGDRPFYVNYIPATDELKPGDWSPASWLTLFYADGLIQIGARDTEGDDTIVIDCNLVEVVDPGAVESTVTHNIASLRISERHGTEEGPQDPPLSDYIKWVDNVIDYPIAAPGGGTAQYEPPIHPAVWQATAQDGAEVAALLAPYIEAVNGRMVPPDFLFDVQANDYGSTVEEALIATWGVKAPWSFPGSRYDALTGFGPMFQLIGGQLDYRQGWEVRGRFAPAPVEVSSELTLDALTSNSDRLLSEFAPNVMLVHLGGIAHTSL